MTEENGVETLGSVGVVEEGKAGSIIDVAVRSRRMLDRKFVKRLDDILAVIKEYAESIEIAKSVMPTKQSFVAWAIENNASAVREYAFTELGKEIVLNMQESDLARLESIYANLPAEAEKCKFCGGTANEVTDGGLVGCINEECPLSDRVGMSIEDWNLLMNKFGK